MMREVDDQWIEALQTEEARDLVEEIFDLLLFGIEDPEDQVEMARLLDKLKKMGENQAFEELLKRCKK